MPYVVRRPRGRWEIRESSWTERGPRSRTLASFVRLTPAIIAKARAAAAAPIGERELWDLARSAGVPALSSVADCSARTLIAELAHERQPAPGLRTLLNRQLCDDGAAVDEAPGGGVGAWLGATPRERGDALRDLLSLGDALPAPERDARLSFPPLNRRG